MHRDETLNGGVGDADLMRTWLLLALLLVPHAAAQNETANMTLEPEGPGKVLDRFANPQPTRKIGMIWRKSSPLHDRLMQVSDLVKQCAPPHL